MLKPIGVGMVTAVLAFLALHGVNVVPLVLVAAVAALFAFTGVGDRLGLHSRFSRLDRVAQFIGFDDIGGQSMAKRELQEALEFLRRPDHIRGLGIRPLKGILLAGPPGTGKTLLAKASATYTDAAFLAASGSEFIEMYAGVGAQRVRQLFRDARQRAKKLGKSHAIVFIDEVEVVAGSRGQHQSHLEYDQTLNQLLVEMDGVEGDGGVPVLVMAATNRADLLDPAITRPGRLDRLVQVDLPDREGRLGILQLHCRNKPLDADVDVEMVARESYGFSGAHLESLCNEAAILALRDGSATIHARHFKDAVDKVLLGERTARQLGPRDKRRVAFHEGGHALVAELMETGSVASVTIAPRGMALGFVRQAGVEERYLHTPEQLTGQIRVCLAGSTAERLCLGTPSTGASNDFEKAWDIARRMVLSGLSPLGVVHEDALSQERLYDTIHGMIDDERIVVENLIALHRVSLNWIALRLMDEETLPGTAVRQALRFTKTAG